MTEVKEKFPHVLVEEQVVGGESIGHSVTCSECGTVNPCTEKHEAEATKNSHEAFHARFAGRPTAIMHEQVTLTDAGLMAWIENRFAAVQDRHPDGADEADCEAFHLHLDGYSEALHDLASYIRALRNPS